jgi:hypothetical protein
MPERLITVAEPALFLRQSKEVWSEAEHDEFVLYIAGNPEAGVVIPDTGSVRKVRWGRAGSGKRGGVRVIYFYHAAERPLYLLMVFAKGRQENLEPDEKRAVRELAAAIKGKGQQRNAWHEGEANEQIRERTDRKHATGRPAREWGQGAQHARDSC